MIRRLFFSLLAAGALVGVAAPVQAGEGEGGEVERVLILSLPNVAWDDIQDQELPNLEALLEQSAIADMSPRGVPRQALAGGAYVTMGAGSRALGEPLEDGLAFGLNEEYAGEPAEDVYERRMGEAPAGDVFSVALPTIEDANDGVPYDPEISALGDALEDEDVDRAVIANADQPRETEGVADDAVTGSVLRREAVLAVADGNGAVPQGAVGPELLMEDPAAPYGVRYDEDAVVAAFDRVWGADREVVLVEASDLARTTDYRELATSEQGDRLWEESLAVTDQLVGALLERVDPATDAVLVVGPYREEGTKGLTVAALRTPDIEPGLLRSATTRRSGFVALGDVAPTVLDLLDIERPSAMEGRAFERGSGGGSYDERVDFLVTAEQEAKFRDTLVTPTGLISVGLQAGLALAAVAAFTWFVVLRRAVPVIEFVALASLAVFPATHLAGLVHFTSAGPYWLFVALVSFAIAAIVLAVGRRDPLDPLLVVLGIMLVLLVVDVVVGAPLQLNTALGYSPTAAFRFAGFGNLAFAELAASAILLACLLVTRLGRRVGLPVGIGVLVVALVADGAPMWGSDVGGVLAATPAFLVTGVMLWGGRIRARAVALAVGATAVAIGAFAVLDRLRPAGAETHLGRLVDRVGDDGWDSFGTVILRKAEASGRTFTDSVWVFMLPVALAFLAYLIWAPPRRLGRLVARYPEMRPALIGVGLAAALGAALNDSGVSVPGVILAVLNGALVYLVLRTAPERSPRP